MDTSQPKPPKAAPTEKQICVKSNEDITSHMMLELGFRTGDHVTPVKKEKSAQINVYTIGSMVNGKITLVATDAPLPGVEADLVEFQQKNGGSLFHRQFRPVSGIHMMKPTIITRRRAWWRASSKHRL